MSSEMAKVQGVDLQSQQTNSNVLKALTQRVKPTKTNDFKVKL